MYREVCALVDARFNLTTGRRSKKLILVRGDVQDIFNKFLQRKKAVIVRMLAQKRGKGFESFENGSESLLNQSQSFLNISRLVKHPPEALPQGIGFGGPPRRQFSDRRYLDEAFILYWYKV